MADEYKSDLRHVQEKLTSVEVSVGQINTKTDEAGRRLAAMEAEIKHTGKNVAMFSQTLVKIDLRLDNLEKELSEKADKVDVDHKLKILTTDIEEMKEEKKKLGETIRKVMVPVIISILTAVGTYFASKLGIADLIK